MTLKASDLIRFWKKEGRRIQGLCSPFQYKHSYDCTCVCVCVWRRVAWGSDWKRTNITKCLLSKIKWALKEHKIRENVSIRSVPLTPFPPLTRAVTQNMQNMQNMYIIVDCVLFPSLWTAGCYASRWELLIKAIPGGLNRGKIEQESWDSANATWKMGARHE